jgi:hypothetical protein
MTKNKLSDLNDHLFTQLERLNEEDLNEDKLSDEVKRAQAMVAISDQIVAAGRLRLRAASLFAEHGDQVLPLLPQIGKSG